MEELCKFEKNFIKTTIDDFIKLLAFHDSGLFGMLYSQKTYDASASGVETVSLSRVGTMMYYYYLIYKEPCPKEPNIIDQERINEIWEAMNNPENVVSTKTPVQIMMYYYYLIYNEECPSQPNSDEQERINRIWILMNMPENVVPSKTALEIMMYYYYLIYNEESPAQPNIDEQKRINGIWILINMPENVVPV